ncbi:MAG: hypothetical protein HYR84_08745, partial [Planctomycetes bacterium]|nr:hypothetical protein [Planctomycetota bacterium]
AEGNVGIGTSTPRNLLDVAGPAYFDSALALGTGTAGGYFSVLEDHPDKNSRVNIYAQGRSGAVELFDANGHTVAMDAASVSLYAAPDTDPDIQLHALGSSKIKARGIIESTYGGFMFPDGSIQTTANTTAEVSLPPWSGPDAQNNISFPGDVNIGGGAASFDDTAERLAIRAQTGEWRVGVKNTPAGADADFFIAMATTPPSTDAFTITPQGNVGIHNLNPPSRLTVGGVIESVSGGFKFPDGTTQITQPVTAINTLHGAIDITGGAGGILVGTSADTEGNHIVISAPLLPPPVGITSINQQHGPAIQLVQGDNVTITSPTSNQIKISATPVGSCTCPVGVEKIKVNSASDAGADGTVLLQAAGAAHLSRVGDTITISSPQPVSTFCVVTNNPQIAQPCTCGTATAIVSNQAGPGSITSDSGTCVGNFSTSRLCQCSP